MSKTKDYDFIVEYAKSSRSECKTSKKKIEKGEMRIGQMVKAPNFDGKIPMWHHWKYFFAKGNRGLTQWEMLFGREKLRLEDQDKIKGMIEKNNSGGTKRKAEGEPDDAPEKKKKKVEEKKEETPEEKAIREENAVIWEYRDKLSGLRPKELREILEKNDQSTKGGEDTLMDRIVSGMMFGSLPNCSNSDCKSGHVYFDKISGLYKCSGNSSAWAKCQWEATEVETTPWKLPRWVSKDIPYFAKWKFVQRKRAVVKSEIIRAEVTEEAARSRGATEEEIKMLRQKRKYFDIGKKTDKPLENLKIAIAGSLSLTQAELKKTIDSLGGDCKTKITPDLTHVVSNKKSVKAEGKRIQDAIKFDIPILKEEFILDSEEKKEILNQKDYLIGGSEYAKKTLEREFTNPTEDEQKDNEAAEKQKEKKVKIVMKGRSAVDPLAGEEVVEKFHVYDKGGSEIYNVVLNVTDVTTNINSYYGLQVLQHDKRKSKFKVFRKWGRVGTTQGSKKIDDFSDEDEAIESFERVYLDKTGNEWNNRDRFKKKPGKFFPIEIDYSGSKDDDDDKLKKVRDRMVDSKSKLDPRIQSLIKLIFDIKLLEKSLTEMEIDLKKMPLGQLSKPHIQKGYQVLTDIEEALKITDEIKKKAKLLELTNKFYTLIPHDFGHKEITIINTQEELKKKMTLMEALIDIEIATNLLKQDDGSESIIDSNYHKLNTDLIALDKDHPDFTMCEKYMRNQRGRYNLELLDAFKVARNGEDDRFKTTSNLGNIHLLWHGSRTTNYVGILSQGLRIAPPEAPKSGYRFGKGIYFADICEKSAFYCRGAGSDYILMMLVEVSLGKIKELKNDKYMEKPLPGSDSTKAMGAIAPKEKITLPNGTIVPIGPPEETGIVSSCEHNEYIVYSVPQACIRYLLKIKLTDR